MYKYLTVLSTLPQVQNIYENVYGILLFITQLLLTKQEVCMGESWPWSRFSHTDRLSLVNKMFITDVYGKQDQFNLFNVTSLY